MTVQGLPQPTPAPGVLQLVLVQHAVAVVVHDAQHPCQAPHPGLYGMAWWRGGVDPPTHHGAAQGYITLSPEIAEENF